MNVRGALSSFFSLNALIWLAMLIALAAVGCFAAAGWLALAPLVGKALAALFTGLGLLVVALLVTLWLNRASRRHESATQNSAPTAPSRSEMTIEDSLRPLIGDRALHWTRQNAGLVTVGAFAAGLVLAASPGTRRFLTRAAGPVVTRKALDTWRSLNDEDQ